MRLRITQKELQLPVFSSFLMVFQKQADHNFFANVLPFVTQEVCDQDRNYTHEMAYAF